MTSSLKLLDLMRTDPTLQAYLGGSVTDPRVYMYYQGDALIDSQHPPTSPSATSRLGRPHLPSRSPCSPSSCVAYVSRCEEIRTGCAHSSIRRSLSRRRTRAESTQVRGRAGQLSGSTEVRRQDHQAASRLEHRVIITPNSWALTSPRRGATPRGLRRLPHGGQGSRGGLEEGRTRAYLQFQDLRNGGRLCVAVGQDEAGEGTADLRRRARRFAPEPTVTG